MKCSIDSKGRPLAVQSASSPIEVGTLIGLMVAWLSGLGSGMGGEAGFGEKGRRRKVYGGGKKTPRAVRQ